MTSLSNPVGSCDVYREGTLIRRVEATILAEMETSRQIKLGYAPGKFSKWAVIKQGRKKKAIQEQWLARMKAIGADRLIGSLQRHNASLGRLTRISVTMYRHHRLDRKQAYVAADEFLLDPLQRIRALYNDRESNIDFEAATVQIPKSEQPRTVIVAERSDLPCGDTTRKRYHEELREANGRQITVHRRQGAAGGAISGQDRRP